MTPDLRLEIHPEHIRTLEDTVLLQETLILDFFLADYELKLRIEINM